MPKLKLTLACWDYDRTRPLIDGRVQAEGIDLEIKVMRPRETFPRMLENKEFEVSELSLGSYVTLKGRGTCSFVAVPVALSKIFRHSCIYIRTDAGIRTPQDLRGKRVGTTQLGSTGVVFMNGMLQHEYGVSLEDIHWFIGGLTDPTPRPVLRSAGENQDRFPTFGSDTGGTAGERGSRRFVRVVYSFPVPEGLASHSAFVSELL
jgi:4,5-dihydroxyphthalate decarboxylase